MEPKRSLIGVSLVIILLAKADDNYELFNKFRLFSGQSWCKLKLFKCMLLVKPKRVNFMLLDIFCTVITKTLFYKLLSNYLMHCFKHFIIAKIHANWVMSSASLNKTELFLSLRCSNYLIFSLYSENYDSYLELCLSISPNCLAISMP